MKKQTITIQTERGPKDIPAHVEGNFAFHKNPDQHLYADYVITHVPTGHRISRGFKTLRQAVEALKPLAHLVACPSWNESNLEQIRNDDNAHELYLELSKR